MDALSEHIDRLGLYGPDEDITPMWSPYITHIVTVRTHDTVFVHEDLLLIVATVADNGSVTEIKNKRSHAILLWSIVSESSLAR